MNRLMADDFLYADGSSMGGPLSSAERQLLGVAQAPPPPAVLSQTVAASMMPRGMSRIWAAVPQAPGVGPQMPPGPWAGKYVTVPYQSSTGTTKKPNPLTDIPWTVRVGKGGLYVSTAPGGGTDPVAAPPVQTKTPVGAGIFAGMDVGTIGIAAGAVLALIVLSSVVGGRK